MTEWSFESDVQRYERLLAQVKSRRFWIAEKPGRPDAEELRSQLGALKTFSPNSGKPYRITPRSDVTKFSIAMLALIIGIFLAAPARADVDYSDLVRMAGLHLLSWQVDVPDAHINSLVIPLNGFDDAVNALARNRRKCRLRSQPDGRGRNPLLTLGSED